MLKNKHIEEVWVDIVGHPHYQVSNLGRVKSRDRTCKHKQGGHFVSRIKKGRILSPNDNGKGYLSVQLGRGKRFYIHRLVAHHFIPNPENHKEVNHINADKYDNAASNLEWCDRQGNIDHSVALGLNLKGEHSPKALLNETKVKTIKALLAEGVKQTEIARKYGVSPKCISDLKLGNTWKHIA
ncbi:MAG: NUMOD4 domain-containing protein [Clostridia bacterium]|nr:NUMOD4 domain-containing protein [Clostridia bacterium]